MSFLYSTIMIKNGTRLFGIVCFASTAVGSFLVGISYGMENATVGPKEYQNANRYITIGVTLISSYGMQLMSNITDATGSFDMGYIIFAALALVATISIWTTRKVVQ